MTLEQAIKRIQDKQSQITQLQREVRDTISKLKDLTPFKVGGKVKVTSGRTIKVCFVSGVESHWRAPYWEYAFKGIKKDGTMSQQSAGIYSYDRVEPA